MLIPGVFYEFVISDRISGDSCWQVTVLIHGCRDRRPDGVFGVATDSEETNFLARMEKFGHGYQRM